MCPKNMAAMALLFITLSCWFKKLLKLALHLWQLQLGDKMSWFLLTCKILELKSKKVIGYRKW
ncbi:hypothetical protein D3C80_2191560 [compost metagenome]